MAERPIAEGTIRFSPDMRSLANVEKSVKKAIGRIENISARGGLLSKNYVQPLGQITGAADEFTKSLEASNARVIAFGASAGIIYSVQRALTASVGATINLEKQLADINVILNETNVGLRRFGDELFNIAKNKIGIVSLFVNPENEFIDTIVHKVSPDLIQLHGSETPKRCFEIKKRFGIPVMKALQINSFQSLKQAYKYEDTVDKLLFDAKLTEEKLQGHKTDTIDWDILKHYNGKKKWMLAGGLNYNNIEEAIKKSNAKYIDISSGVESSPGVKSKVLIKKLIQKIKKLNSK